MESSIRHWVAGFFSSRNIVAILLSHWESWLGFGMTINPGKRKTRRFALGKSKKERKKSSNKKQLPSPEPAAFHDQGTSLLHITPTPPQLSKHLDDIPKIY